MNKGIKGIAIVIVIVLALALGLSACDKTEYYSVNVTSNLANDPAVQINVSASKDKNGYQKGESAYVSISVAPGSKYVVESVNAKTPKQTKNIYKHCIIFNNILVNFHAFAL